MESLAKSLSPNEKLTKLVTNTQQHKNEPFQFYFTNHQSNLDNTELNILCNALSIEDNTKCLYLSHQKNFLNLEALGKFVENSRCLRQLDISFSDVGDFTPVFSAINTDGANIGYETQEDLENFGKNLQYLNISGNSVSVSDAKLLAEKLKSNQNLLALKLHNCDLNIDSIIQIFEALNENRRLESLDLSNQNRLVNPYNLSTHIQKYFQNNVKTLVRLNLKHLNLTDQSVYNIVQGLLHRDCQNSLKHFDISSNKLSRDAALSLVTLLQHPNCKIETLNISRNRIENSGIIKILQTLDHKNPVNGSSGNKSLKTLILKSIEASEPAWIQAEAILNESNNTSLKEIYVWGNCFEGQQGAASLKSLIESRRFRSGMSIDVQPYVVDSKILMAEDPDSCFVAENKFHAILDDEW